MRHLRAFSRIWISIFLAMLFFSFPLLASAAPTSHFLNVPIVGQSPMVYWCWISCGTSVVKYAGYNITNNDFALATIGNATYDVPGTVLDVQSGLSNWSISSNCVPNSLAYSTVKNNLYSGKPCIAAIAYVGASIGHTVVIDGYDESPIFGNIIQIMDPDSAGSRQLVPFTYFNSNSYYYWANSMYNIQV